MIEQALVAALQAALPTATIYPGIVPEGMPLPWVVYRQTDTNTFEGFYKSTQSPTFELDAAFDKGLEPENYMNSKIMANDIQAALIDGFDLAGVCVYNVDIEKTQDMIDDVDGLFWTRSTYTLRYDSPLAL